ncbi:MAG: hemerythrin domain-containing protein [Nitrospira sp.]
MPQPAKNAGRTNKKGTATASADAVQMLEQDHRAVERLFSEFDSGDAKRKQAIAHQIFKELEVHGTIEEEIFYPALRKQADLGELGDLEQGESDIAGQEGVDEEEDDEDDETAEEVGEDVLDSAYEDHQAVKDLIGTLRGRTAQDPDFESGMAELRELVTNHVAEEEEVLFAEAKLKLDTAMVGRQMQERKQALA